MKNFNRKTFKVGSQNLLFFAILTLQAGPQILGQDVQPLNKKNLTDYEQLPLLLIEKNVPGKNALSQSTPIIYLPITEGAANEAGFNKLFFAEIKNHHLSINNFLDFPLDPKLKFTNFSFDDITIDVGSKSYFYVLNPKNQEHKVDLHADDGTKVSFKIEPDNLVGLTYGTNFLGDKNFYLFHPPHKRSIKIVLNLLGAINVLFSGAGPSAALARNRPFTAINIPAIGGSVDLQTDLPNDIWLNNIHLHVAQINGLPVDNWFFSAPDPVLYTATELGIYNSFDLSQVKRGWFRIFKQVDLGLFYRSIRKDEPHNSHHFRIPHSSSFGISLAANWQMFPPSWDRLSLRSYFSWSPVNTLSVKEPFEWMTQHSLFFKINPVCRVGLGFDYIFQQATISDSFDAGRGGGAAIAKKYQEGVFNSNLSFAVNL